MARVWSRKIALAVAMGVSVGAWARTAGPDEAGTILIDSAESDGPPHVWVDAAVGEAHSPGLFTLPFGFQWGGITQNQVMVGDDGSLLFAGDVASCPTSGEWSGFATGKGGEIQHRTIGRFPNRGLLWDWGDTQIALLERRSEAVLRLAAATDEQVAGAQSGPGTGLVWGCEDTRLLSDRSAWVSEDAVRSVATLRSTNHLEHAWWGSRAAEFFGESVAVGDVNDDGLTDILVGEPEGDVAFLFFGQRSERVVASDAAALVIHGVSGSRFGHAVEMADMDGDGLDDLIISAPRDGAGAVHIFLAADGVDGLSESGEASSTIRGPGDLGAAGMGTSLAVADVTGDETLDLIVGAPNAQVDDVPVGGVLIAADYTWADGEHTLDAADGFWSDAAGTQAGEAVAAIDMNGDGVSYILVSAPYADTTDSDEGRVFVVPPLSEGSSLEEASSLVIDGLYGGELFGSALAVGNLDDVGTDDLVIGAVGRNVYGARTGAVSVFLNVNADDGDLDVEDADVVIVGTEGAQAAGASIHMGQLDDDPEDELLVGATGGLSSRGGGGMVAVFRTLPDGESDLNDADHRLYSPDGGGELGADVVVAGDIQGDGYPDLVVAAPLDTPGELTGAGAVWVWPFVPAYLDDDEDGFVAHVSGGLDCDDANDAVHPNVADVADNMVDDDCDGWVDERFIPRKLDSGWRYDLSDVLGVSASVKFDFEDAEDGAEVETHYAAEGMSLYADGFVRAQDDIWGAAPVGLMGARVTAGSDANDLIMVFGSPIDAIGMRIIDAEVLMRLDTLLDGELTLDGYQFYADGPDTPGGVFQGFTFAEPVDTVRIAASSPNGWGVDDIEVVYSVSSDRDGDGLSAEDGDCDDFDASVGPGAEERYGDGVDNDCDGVVDAGVSDLFLSEGEFTGSVSIFEERIDFETPELGSEMTDFYADLGVEFAGDLIVEDEVGGSLPRDAQAAVSHTDSLVINFSENQPAVSMWVLDPVGSLSFEARRDGIVLYSGALPTGAAGFVGMFFPVPIDALVIEHDVSGDKWGIDDLTLSVLGRDDADGDGFTEADGDCDDDDPAAYPGGEEVWYDGIDGDCEGDDDFDADGDGYSSPSGGGFDCDDFIATTHPGAEDDWYDGVDSDCMGDDDFDADGDGHGSTLFGGSDCDDESAAISPDADEVFYDEVDDDCDPTTDYDSDGDGFAAAGYPGAIGVYGVGDCDDEEGTTHPGAVETWYDSIDSDCGGDDDFDADGDGHIPFEFGGSDCDDAAAVATPDAVFDDCYDGLDTDCDEHSDFDCDRDGYDDVRFGGWDCDDADETVFPGDGTSPDGPDLDCDGFVDVEAGGDDCDDADPMTHPGATDLWYDGRDDDCDGADDFDRDGDGYRVSAWAEDPSVADCDDGDSEVHPGIIWDDCGGGDEDCDGVTDEDCGAVPDSGMPDEESDDFEDGSGATGTGGDGSSAGTSGGEMGTEDGDATETSGAGEEDGEDVGGGDEPSGGSDGDPTGGSTDGPTGGSTDDAPADGSDGDDTASVAVEEDTAASADDDTGTSAEAEDEPEGGVPSDEDSAVAVEAGSSTTPGGKRGKEGCGCQTANPAPSVAVMLALWLCGMRRRQSA